MKDTKQAINEAADGLGEHLKKNRGDEYANLTEKAFQKDVTMKSLAGVSDQKEEAIYGQAYLLYNTGRFKEASEVFRVLIMINSLEAKYMMGLGACFHMMKAYDSAVAAYTVSTFLDPENPVPHFHLYDCFIQQNDEASAIVALTAAIKKSEGKPEFKTLHERCQLTLDGLQKKVAEETKKTGKEKS